MNFLYPLNYVPESYQMYQTAIEILVTMMFMLSFKGELIFSKENGLGGRVMMVVETKLWHL